MQLGPEALARAAQLNKQMGLWPVHLAPVSFCGRRFWRPELEVVRRIAGEFGSLGVTEIARTLSTAQLEPPNGGLKNHDCRPLLGRLAPQGWLRSPPVRPLGPQGPGRVRTTVRSDPRGELDGTAGDREPPELKVVEPGPEGAPDSALSYDLVQRYH